MTDPTDALAAALHAIGGFADDFPRPTAAEREDAVGLLAALAASGWTLAPVETEQANLAGFREGLAHAKVERLARALHEARFYCWTNRDDVCTADHAEGARQLLAAYAEEMTR